MRATDRTSVTKGSGNVFADLGFSPAESRNLLIRAQMMTAAVNLTRGKMYDIEETLIVDGFQEMDQTEEGNFSDEGWSQIQWKAEIVKIELPDMSTLQGMNGEAGAEGAEGESATGAPAAGGLLGGMLGGVGGTDPNSAAGAGIKGTN